MVWNSINNRVYCAASQNTVTVIDGVTNTVVTIITVGDWPWGMTWNSIQNRIYVGNLMSSNVSVIRDAVGIEEYSTFDTKCSILEIYPNPFYSSTNITYSLDRSSNVSLKIYNVAGQCIKHLVNREQNAGISEINWHGNDDDSRELPQGIYFVRISTEGYTEVKKIIHVK